MPEGQLIQADGGTDVILSLEEMIKNNADAIDMLKGEKKKVSNMLDDTYNGNPLYLERKEEAKKASKALAEVKAQISAQPSVKEMIEKKKYIASELKERNGAVSDYLLEYERISGMTQLSLFDESLVQIVKVAKLVRV